jgi:hypothetical protein
MVCGKLERLVDLLSELIDLKNGHPCTINTMADLRLLLT